MRRPKTTSGGRALSILDTIAVALLSLFCLGIIGVLWFDWRGMVRDEAERYADGQNNGRRQTPPI